MPDADLELAIDRIVDGGLSPAELREAIACIEAAPEGWRRCTLAFIEARCWGDAFRELAPPTGHALRIADEPPRRPSRRLRPALAAAVAVACFAAGWLAAGRPSGPVADQAPPILAAAAEPASAAAAPSEVSPAAPEPKIRQVARLRIGGGPADAGAPEVPIYGGPGLDPSWVLDQPMPVSPRERAALARQGYQLEQERHLVAVPLPDGRRLVVPVDRVRVQDVSSRSL